MSERAPPGTALFMIALLALACWAIIGLAIWAVTR